MALQYEKLDDSKALESQEVRLILRITSARRFGARLWIAGKLLLLASWILNGIATLEVRYW